MFRTINQETAQGEITTEHVRVMEVTLSKSRKHSNQKSRSSASGSHKARDKQTKPVELEIGQGTPEANFK